MSNDKRGTLVLLACHCVFDPTTDRIYAEHATDRPIYDAHLNYAFKHIEWRVIDGSVRCGLRANAFPTSSRR